MNLLLLTISAIGVVIFCKIARVLYAYYAIRKKISHIPEADRPFSQLLQISQKENRKLLLNKNTNGLYKIWIGLQPRVYVIKPEFIQSIFQNKTHVEKAETYDYLKPWFPNGLLIAPAELWYKHRKIILPTFHFNTLDQFAVIMSEKTEDMIKYIEKNIARNSTKVIDIFPFIQKITLNVICETMMGINLDDEEITSYLLATHRFFNLRLSRITSSSWLGMSNWIYDLSPQGREIKMIINFVHNLSDKIIRQKKVERMQNNKVQNQKDNFDISDKQEKETLLDRLLDINEKDNVSLTDDDLRSHVSLFLLAGYETTATAIRWALFCIGNDFECQEKIHEELKEVFKDSQKSASVRELSQLKYLERVIKESHRLYPSVPIIARKISENIKMDNYIIPKDTSVAAYIMFLHRNPEIWPDPLKFDPDRFLPENMKQIHPYAYIPFSAGPRNCIGQKFAMIEEKTILAAILRKWRVKSMEAHEDLIVTMSFTLQPNNGSVYLHLLPKK